VAWACKCRLKRGNLALAAVVLLVRRRKAQATAASVMTKPTAKTVLVGARHSSISLFDSIKRPRCKANEGSREERPFLRHLAVSVVSGARPRETVE
jgi:hypothetical protein